MSNSLVVPVYRNAGTVPELVDTINLIAAQLVGPLDVVFVIDGSPDNSRELLLEHLRRARFEARLVEHSRNFGSFAAIRTGLSLARGERIAVMAADLQEPPDLVVSFLKRLARGDVDVVAGDRVSRDDRGDFASKIYWRLYQRYILDEIPSGGVDVFGCTATVRDVICSLESTHTSLVAQLFWVGFRRELIPYHRRPSDRPSGWSMAGKVRYLLDSVFAFTNFPIRVMWLMGMFGILVATVVGGVVLGARVAGLVTVPGYAATILILLFFASLNLIGLGIIGSYVWRAYEITKGRPGAIVRDVTEISSPRAAAIGVPVAGAPGTAHAPENGSPPTPGVESRRA